MRLYPLTEYARWRVVCIHYAAKLIGVTVHVEGFPYGSSRTRRAQQGEAFSGQTEAAEGTAQTSRGS